ncbi:hypothetical protein N665_0067s0039 [Sinapis alba]|nr:hypothetical protein N665_0067s0039 [Sinapis alba]
MFADKLGDTMEVYIDDMLVKSLHAKNHLDHLRDCFKTLNEYRMKLNPAKCTFGVTSGKFLGYIVTQRGIKANPRQITAILDLPSPKNSCEVQQLTGWIAALNRFIARSTDKCLPFYELLRGNKRFVWDEKCEEAFNQMKHYLTTPLVLSKPEVGDTLSLYIAVTSSAVNSVLIREDRGEQKPIFYISKRMTEPGTRYTSFKKMAPAVVTSKQKLRPYFQSHTIEILSNQPLRMVMQNTNKSGRLTKWAMELSEYDIVYKNRTAAKSQVLADFLISVQLQSPTGELIRQSFSFGFAASNNEAEYKSLIARLRLVKAVKAHRVSAYYDSQLVVTSTSATMMFPVGKTYARPPSPPFGSKLHDQEKRTILIHKIEKPSIDTMTEQMAIAAYVTNPMQIDEPNPHMTENQDQDW